MNQEVISTRFKPYPKHLKNVNQQMKCFYGSSSLNSNMVTAIFYGFRRSTPIGWRDEVGTFHKANASFLM